MSYVTRYYLSWSGATRDVDCATEALRQSAAAEWRTALALALGGRCSHPNRLGAKFCDECGKARAPIDIDAEIESALRARGVPPPHRGCLGTRMWLEHERHMGEISREVPGVLFHLHGRGDDEDDVWDLFARDGRVQRHRARIVRVESPDESAWCPPGGP